jgi:hypothetical protein
MSNSIQTVQEKESVYVVFHEECHVAIYKDLVCMLMGTGLNKQWVSKLAKCTFTSFTKVEKFQYKHNGYMITATHCP